MFKNGEIVATIPARWTLNPSYMHSFGEFVATTTLYKRNLLSDKNQDESKKKQT